MEKMLEGKNALVTGAGRGIGRSIALALAREGANVLVNYRHSEEAARALVLELEALGVRAEAMRADVSRFDDAKALVAAIKPWGGLDILVNNAGINRDRILARMSPDDWGQVIATNLNGVFNVTRAAIFDMMKRRHGRVINIASVSGIVGMAGQINYSSAKAGVIGFTHSLAREVGPYQVTVNAVAPGLIETEMLKSIPDKILQQQIALTRGGRRGVSGIASSPIHHRPCPLGRWGPGHVTTRFGVEVCARLSIMKQIPRRIQPGARTHGQMPMPLLPPA